MKTLLPVRLPLYLVLILLFTACGKESITPPLVDTAPVSDPIMEEQGDLKIDESTFLNIRHIPGIQDSEVSISDGNKWRFRLDIPESSTNENELRPLIIGLVGAAAGIDRHIVFYECLIGPGLENIETYIFLPEPGPWTHKIVTDKIFHFIELAIKHWNVNPDQIVITGYSKGGEATWNYAIKYPQVFEAAIPMGGTHILNEKPTIPIYGIIGENDGIFSAEKMRQQVSESSFMKSHTQVVGGLHHHEVCEFIYSLRDAAQWLKDCVFKE